MTGKTRILIVEDEFIIAELLRRKLEGLGHQVIGIVANGRDALEAAAASKPDLVLMDIVIQGDMDGIKTTDLLLKEHDIPVVYLTAYSDEETLKRAEGTRAYGYILKPFNEREVHAVVKMTLSRHGHDRELKESVTSAGQLGKALDATLRRLVLQVDRSDIANMQWEIERGIERNEFVMYYQPQVSLASGRIIGAEALMRWDHPERGRISPGKFIPVAEECGLIVPLGEFALESACVEMDRWQRQFNADLKISVNLSVRQLGVPDIADRISRILQRLHYNPALLELEVTESLLVEDWGNEARTLSRIKGLGVSLAIDDFGTGYSALGNLKRFPIDVIKIDRSFFVNGRMSPDFLPITVAILRMSRELKMMSIAEGVETDDELQFLHEHQCDAIQGYLFSPAVPAAEFAQLLERESQSSVMSASLTARR